MSVPLTSTSTVAPGAIALAHSRIGEDLGLFSLIHSASWRGADALTRAVRGTDTGLVDGNT
jgi:hypothetical protein